LVYGVDKVYSAAELLRDGAPIFVYDFDEREGEVDLVMRASAVDASTVSWIRKNAGGLLCFVTEEEVGAKLGLGLMSRMLVKLGLGDLVKRPSYGDEPAFSIYVNHVNTRTGIRDHDRALTISRLSYVVDLVVDGNVEEGNEVFKREFYAPGHVPILLGRVGSRTGHTELALILSRIAKIPPALVIVEMLSDQGAMGKDEAEAVAKSMGTLLVEGREILRVARLENRHSGHHIR